MRAGIWSGDEPGKRNRLRVTRACMPIDVNATLKRLLADLQTERAEIDRKIVAMGSALDESGISGWAAGGGDEAGSEADERGRAESTESLSKNPDAACGPHERSRGYASRGTRIPNSCSSSESAHEGLLGKAEGGG